MSVTGSILAATGLAGAGISAYGANKAAGTQADAANNAANISRQNAIDALNFQKQVYGDQQRNIQPWLQTGSASMYDLARLMGLNVPGPQQAQTQPTWNTGGTQNISDLLNSIRGGNGVNPITSGGGGNVGGAVPMQANSSMVGKLPTASPTSPTPTGSVLNGLLPGEGGTPGGAVPMTTGSSVPTGAGGAVSMSAGGGGSTAPIINGPNAGPGGDFGSLAKPFGETFQAPTDVTEQNDPGYQFRLKTAMDQLTNSAAARGGLLSGGTAKAMNDYAQNSASNEYSNVYNRALGEFQQRYNIYNNDQSTLFNRLMALAGGGQTAAGQLNSAGSNASGNVANILLGSAGQQGQDLNNAGAARASGYVGGANAASGELNNLGNLALLSHLLNNGAPNNAGWGVV